MISNLQEVKLTRVENLDHMMALHSWLQRESQSRALAYTLATK